MKKLYDMQKQAKQMKKELSELEIEAEEDGVVVVVNGAQELIEVTIAPELLAPEHKSRIERNLKAGFLRANKKAQEVAAEKMKPYMGDMLGGLGG